MKTKILLTALALLVLASCSGDQSTSLEPDEEILLAVETLGIAGGTLETSDFALAVPAGAFGSPTELRLYESKETHGFGDNSRSRLFRLEGLPEVFTESLTVRIQCQDEMNGDAYIAVGTEETVLTGGIERAQMTVYRLTSTSTGPDYIESKLPPQEAPRLSEPGRSIRCYAGTPRKMSFVALANYGSSQTSEHFVIRYPLYVARYADDLLAYFEAAHDTVVSLGMGYDGRLWPWPAEIVVKDYPSEDYGYARVDEEKPPLITVDERKMSEALLSRFEAFALIAVMDVAQMTPDPKDYWQTDNVWWHMAVLFWFTSEFGGQHVPAIPDQFVGNELKALWGLPVGIGTVDLATDHGAGWSAILEFLTRRYGRNLIGSVYQDIRVGTRPVTAFLDRVPGPEYNWWPHFVDEYLGGNIYDVESSVFLTGVSSSDRFTIRTAADTLWEVDKACDQLSGQLFRITPDYALVDETAYLKLTVASTAVDPSYFLLLVYREKNDVITYVGEGDTVYVNGLQELTIEGYEILAALVNCFTELPYSENPVITLTARVGMRPIYNWCRINVGHLSAYFTTSDDADHWEEDWAIEWEGNGSFFENTFVATWSQRPNPLGEVCAGELTVELDAASLGVTSFRASETCVSPLGYQSVDGISGGGVPFHESTVIPNPYLSCRTQGATACEKISDLHYTMTYNESGISDELDHWLCGDDSAIYITFWYSDGR